MTEFYAIFLVYHDTGPGWGVEMSPHPGPPLVMTLAPGRAEGWHTRIAETVAEHAMFGSEWDTDRFRDPEADSYWIPTIVGDRLLADIPGWVEWPEPG